MPRVQMFGRRWHFSTDILPIPVSIVALFHLAMVLVIFILPFRRGYLPASCSDPIGRQHIAVLSTFAGLYLFSLLVEIAMLLASCRGAPFETRKRRFVVPLLYFSILPMVLHLPICIYGTPLVNLRSTCWPPEMRSGVRRLMRGVVFSCWALIALFIVWAISFVSVFEAPVRSDEEQKRTVWRKRIRCIAACCCCGGNLATVRVGDDLSDDDDDDPSSDEDEEVRAKERVALGQAPATEPPAAVAVSRDDDQTQPHAGGRNGDEDGDDAEAGAEADADAAAVTADAVESGEGGRMAHASEHHHKRGRHKHAHKHDQVGDLRDSAAPPTVEPLTSIAELTTGLLAHVDFDPSDLACAIVLASAEQTRRRALQTTLNLLPVLQTITGSEGTFQEFMAKAETEGTGTALRSIRADGLPSVREATDEHEAAATAAAAASMNHPESDGLSPVEAAAAGVLAQAAIAAVTIDPRTSAIETALGSDVAKTPSSPSGVTKLLKPSATGDGERDRDGSPPERDGSADRKGNEEGDRGATDSGADAAQSSTETPPSRDGHDTRTLKLASSAGKAQVGAVAGAASASSDELAALGADAPQPPAARSVQLAAREFGRTTSLPSLAIAEATARLSTTSAASGGAPVSERRDLSASSRRQSRSSGRRLFGVNALRSSRRPRGENQDPASTLADVVDKLEGAVETLQDPTRADRGVLSLRAAGVQAKDIDPASGVIWVRKGPSSRDRRVASRSAASSACCSASPGSGKRGGSGSGANSRPTSRSTARGSTAEESAASGADGEEGSEESFESCDSESNASLWRLAPKETKAAEVPRAALRRGSRGATSAATSMLSRLSNSGGLSDFSSAVSSSGRQKSLAKSRPSSSGASGRSGLPGAAPEPLHGLRERFSEVRDRLHLGKGEEEPDHLGLARDTTGAISAGLVVSEDELDDPETGRAAPNPTDEDISAFLHRVSHANVASGASDDGRAWGSAAASAVDGRAWGSAAASAVDGRAGGSAAASAVDGRAGGSAAASAVAGRTGDAGTPSVSAADDRSLPPSVPPSELERASVASTAAPAGDSDLGVGRAPVLTPTWATAELAGGALSPEAVAALSADSATMARVKELDDVSHFLKYANAAYYLVPEPDQSKPLLDRVPMCRPKAATEGVIRGLQEIDPEDGFSRKSVELLHLNASNSVLAHVPYLIALDHNRRCVVIAVRGTISAADVVTDAVVKPERVYGLPKRIRDAMGGVPPFAHAGMVASARALYRDIAARGLLGDLPRWPLGEREERIELESGHVMDTEARAKRPSSGGERGVEGVARSGEGARHAAAKADGKAESRDLASRSDPSGARKSARRQRSGSGDGSEANDADSQRPELGARLEAEWTEGTLPDEGLIPPPPPFSHDSDEEEEEEEAEEEGRAEEGAVGGIERSERGQRVPRADSPGASPSGGDDAVPLDSPRAQETTPIGVRARSVRELILRRGWRLVIVGHSLGAGVASLLTARLLSTFPDVRCLAYCCPGATTSVELGAALADVVTSVAVGKDVVPRASVPNLGRLVDELVVALAMCRVHKLHVLLVPGYARGAAALRDRAKVFYDFGELPDEAREALRRYLRARARDGRALTTVPPGRLLFMRPLKRGRERRGWTGVWVEPRALIDEGILLSSHGVSDHGVLNLRDALVDARKRSDRLESGVGGGSHKAFLGMSMDAWEAIGVPSTAVKRARRLARWGMRVSGGDAIAKGAKYALNGFGTFAINGEVSSSASSRDLEERNRDVEEPSAEAMRNPSSASPAPPLRSPSSASPAPPLRSPSVAPPAPSAQPQRSRSAAQLQGPARGFESVVPPEPSARFASREPSNVSGAPHRRRATHALAPREDSFRSEISLGSSAARAAGSEAHPDGSGVAHATESTASESAFGHNVGPRASEWDFSGQGAPDVKHKRRGIARRQVRMVRRAILGSSNYSFKGIPALERTISDIVAE